MTEARAHPLYRSVSIQRLSAWDGCQRGVREWCHSESPSYFSPWADGSPWNDLPAGGHDIPSYLSRGSEAEAAYSSDSFVAKDLMQAARRGEPTVRGCKAW